MVRWLKGVEYISVPIFSKHLRGFTSHPSAGFCSRPPEVASAGLSVCDLVPSGGQECALQSGWISTATSAINRTKKNDETSSGSADRGSSPGGPALFVNINYYCYCLYFIFRWEKKNNSQFHFMLADDVKFHTLGLLISRKRIFHVFCFTFETMSFFSYLKIN